MRYAKKYNDSEKKSTLSIILRQLRLNAGFTQQNVADALNINRSTYTYYETGKTTPDIQTLKRLSRIFDVTIDTFLEEQPIAVFSDYVGKRPKKKIFNNPTSVSELSSDEKSIIAILRAKADEEETKKLIEALKDKTEEE